MPNERITVLLVEDDEDIREAIGIILEDEGYLFLTASNGAQAIHTLTNRHVDLVLLDLTLPDVEPEELVEGIRKLADYPIVLLSGVRDLATIAHSLRAAGYLEKPFDTHQLLQMVHDLTQKPSTAS